VSVDTSILILAHTLSRVCTGTRVCVVCSLAFGDESGGVQLLYARHLLLTWGIILDKRKDRGVCMYLFYVDGNLESMCVGVFVYTHTHTHAARGVLGCEPLGRDGKSGEPKESKWTKSQDTCIRICVQRTLAY